MRSVADADGEASALYRMARADPYDPPGGLRLARLLLGDGSVIRSASIPCAAEFRPEHRAIFVRPSLTPRELNFAVCHELAEWHMDSLDYRRADREQLCNQIAARLLAPREAMRALLREVTAVDELAQCFIMSETVAALRIGEVTGRPVAVVTPGWIAVRGDDWGWPSERRLRLIARGVEAAPEINRQPLGDEPRRVMLAAA